MIKKLTELFRVPSAEQLALRELESAKRELLNAQSAHEYAKSMVGYHSERIRRLSHVLPQGANRT